MFRRRTTPLDLRHARIDRLARIHLWYGKEYPVRILSIGENRILATDVAGTEHMIFEFDDIARIEPYLSTTVARLAMKIERDLWNGYLAYREAAEQSTYDSRGKRSYTEAFCEHGKSRWTEYDNICGYCEDGVSMRDGLTRRAEALSEAKDRIAKATELFELQLTLRKHGIELPEETRKEISAQCSEYLLINA